MGLANEVGPPMLLFGQRITQQTYKKNKTNKIFNSKKEYKNQNKNKVKNGRLEDTLNFLLTLAKLCLDVERRRR